MPRVKAVTVEEDYSPVPAGQPLAPPPDELFAVMTNAEVLEDLKPLASLNLEMDSFERGQALGMVSNDNDVRSRERGVSHKRGPLQTLYSINGDSRSITINDVPMLIDPSIPSATRLYLRCPICIHMPNNGLHRFSGPNACPGKPKKLWSACPICRNHGHEHRVFEDEAFDSKPRDLETDENYVAPRMPNHVEREDRLRMKLELHMVTFHAGEANQLFGLRRRSINGGQAFVVDDTSGPVAPSED
jgi:hypothetical protein